MSMPIASALTSIFLCWSALELPWTANGFLTWSRNHFSSSPPRISPITTSLLAFQGPSLPSFATAAIRMDRPGSSVGERNGLDPDYPWRFEGRFIFRPSLVRVSECVQPTCADILSLFGYSLGGSVVLEYDVSPVGPYREYVAMGGLVGLGRVNIGENDATIEKALGIGQWGTNLYVSTQVAEDVCRVVWGVPAQVADIELVETGDELIDGPDEESYNNIDEGRRRFTLGGWKNARILNSDETKVKRYGNLPIYWTPTIKALWAPVLFPGVMKMDDRSATDEQLLPLHKLRLSASALTLRRCKRTQSSKTIISPLHEDSGEIPLGLALAVDNVLIEVGERITTANV